MGFGKNNARAVLKKHPALLFAGDDLAVDILWLGVHRIILIESSIKAYYNTASIPRTPSLERRMPMGKELIPTIQFGSKRLRHAVGERGYTHCSIWMLHAAGADGKKK